MVTALPHEARAVTEHLSDCQEVNHPKGTTYVVGRLKGSAARWKVAVVQTGPGNASAAQATERAINYFHPEVALFSGVAGSRKDAQVGDIVVADKVYGYESGKDTDEGLLARPELFVPSYRLLQRAQLQSLQEAWLARVGTGSPGPSPRLFVKPIASGEKLIASSKADIADLLTRNYGDAVAVEMEGHGFLKAVHANPGVEALLIRGISDLLDNKGRVTDSEDQLMAARHAATFALELLASMEPGPRAHGGRPPSEDSARLPEHAESIRLGAMELKVQRHTSGDEAPGGRLDSFLLRMQSRWGRPEDAPPPARKTRLLIHFLRGEADHPSLDVSLRAIPLEEGAGDDKQEPLLKLSLDFTKSDELLSVLESIVSVAVALTNEQATRAVRELAEASARQ
ncbi:MAG TPA: 5'-methylthioadenosine/S-adenosylhomocysteine nucleosidase, partial [Myxococcaceae bacterium]